MVTRAPPRFPKGHGTLLLKLRTSVEQAPWDADFDPMPILASQPLVGLYLIQDETFRWCNEAYARQTGYRPEELIGQHVSMICAPDSVQTILEYMRMRERGDAQSIHYLNKGRDRNGRTVYLESHGVRTIYKGRPAVAGININVTERVLRERALTRATARLQALTSHNNDARERARAHVARELHDVLGGILTSLKMDVSRLARRQSEPELRAMTDSIMALAQQAVDEVHRLSQDLRPAVLEHLGLKAAISDALARFETRYSIATSMNASGSDPPLEPLQLVSVFRIFQETLSNVGRHAGASRVAVTLVEGDQGLWLSVADNGRGITAEQREAPSAFGILGMRERVAQLHGKLDIEGVPGEGTTVTLRVPISSPKAAR
jgi:two-component system, NarL family, sensor histidine kinase UhpB